MCTYLLYYIRNAKYKQCKFIYKGRRTASSWPYYVGIIWCTVVGIFIYVYIFKLIYCKLFVIMFLYIAQREQTTFTCFYVYL